MNTDRSLITLLNNNLLSSIETTRKVHNIHNLSDNLHLITFNYTVDYTITQKCTTWIPIH